MKLPCTHFSKRSFPDDLEPTVRVNRGRHDIKVVDTSGKKLKLNIIGTCNAPGHSQLAVIQTTFNDLCNTAACLDCPQKKTI